MSRYVDIEGDWVDDAVKVYSLGYYDDDEYAIPFEALDSAPSIDICFCRECKHWHDHITSSWCSRGAELRPQESGWIKRNPDDFCSYGERKENE